MSMFWKGNKSPDKSHKVSVDSFCAEAKSKVPENNEKIINVGNVVTDFDLLDFTVFVVAHMDFGRSSSWR